MIKVAEHTISRYRVAAYAFAVAVLIGVAKAIFYPIDFTFTVTLFQWLGAALVVVLLLHECTHAAVAMLFGYRPIFGCQPPLIFVTFKEKIPWGRFMTIAVTPLLFLNIVFGFLFTVGVLKVFSYFFVMMNTLGSAGDVWVFFKLLGEDRRSFIQDTEKAIVVWKI